MYAIRSYYDMSVAELKSLNHLTGNKIKPGQLLTLAKAATETTESAPTACPPPALSHEKKSLLEKTALSFLNMPYRLGGRITSYNVCYTKLLRCIRVGLRLQREKLC